MENNNKENKTLNRKQWTIIYSLIAIISFILVIILTSVFISSKIKNDSLQSKYNQVYNDYVDVEEESKIKNDSNYQDAVIKDNQDIKDPTYEVFSKNI